MVVLKLNTNQSINKIHETIPNSCKPYFTFMQLFVMVNFTQKHFWKYYIVWGNYHHSCDPSILKYQILN